MEASEFLSTSLLHYEPLFPGQGVPDHGVKMVKVAWARKGTRFTMAQRALE